MDDTELVRQISAHCRTSPDERVLRRVLSILQRARGGGGAVDEGRRRSKPLNAAMATGGELAQQGTVRCMWNDCSRPRRAGDVVAAATATLRAPSP